MRRCSGPRRWWAMLWAVVSLVAAAFVAGCKHEGNTAALAEHLDPTSPYAAALASAFKSREDGGTPADLEHALAALLAAEAARPATAQYRDMGDADAFFSEGFISLEEALEDLRAGVEDRAAKATPEEALALQLALLRLHRLSFDEIPAHALYAGSLPRVDGLATLLRALWARSPQLAGAALAALDQMPPVPSAEEMQHDLLRGPTRRFLQSIAETMLDLMEEEGLIPELKPGSDAAAKARIAALRLSGMVDYGKQQQLFLEEAGTGAKRTVQQGSAEAGIELISVDFKARCAWIRVDGMEARVRLESRDVLPSKRRMSSLRKFLKHRDLSLADLVKDDDFRLLIAARSQPGGIGAYFDSIATHLERDARSALAARFEARYVPTPLGEGLPEMLQAIGKAVVLIPRAVRAREIQVGMLQQSVRLLSSPPGAPLPDLAGDGWTASVSLDKDGAWILTSNYQDSSGNPVTLTLPKPKA